MSDQKFQAILIDPPWAFETFSKTHTTPHRSAEDHYGTMSHADLLALPIEALAAENCAMFMWVVDSHLPEALDLMTAWGFKFKTIAFNWVKVCREDLSKPRVGMGYWSRKQAEICLMGTRGKPRRVSKGVEQVLLEIEPCTVLMEPREAHSRKPTAFYDRIEELVAGPYLEVFGRTQRKGWDIWGNQAGDSHPLLKPLFDAPIQMPCPPSSD